MRLNPSGSTKTFARPAARDVIGSAAWGAGGCGCFGQLSISEDCAKYVVEVMGDSAGKRPDCLHLL
jgi:hypothetical protein